VNAVLRSIASRPEARALPPRPAPPEATLEAQLEYLTVTLSHPRWLAERWLKRYGFEATAAWMAFDNEAAPITLRVNPLRGDRDTVSRALASRAVHVSPGRFGSDALIVTDGNPLISELADRGLYLLQDEASQLVGELVRAKPGEWILDACAAPGGKTTQLAAAMRDAGMLVATDVRGARLDLLRQTVRAMGCTNVRILRTDAGTGLPFRDVFDAVLLDAPCSGLGVLRRDPEIRWRRSEHDLPALAAAQRAMMRAAAATVRPGGRLVYSTCSSEPDENEDVVRAFLDEHSGFAREDPRSCADTPAGLLAVIDVRGHLRTYPHVHGLEAFFGAVLKRMEN
jgi:16S rRNA (cytosine967-C5)-methyltransferase